MDDKRRFYVVRLGQRYVKDIRYLPIVPPSKRNEITLTLTSNSLAALTYEDESIAQREADKTGGEVSCFGIYDAKTTREDPVEALFGPVGSSSGHQFDWALRQMMSGNRVYREDWSEENVWIAIQVADENDPTDLPFIYMRLSTGSHIPWSPSQTDLLQHDWLLMED